MNDHPDGIPDPGPPDLPDNDIAIVDDLVGGIDPQPVIEPEPDPVGTPEPEPDDGGGPEDPGPPGPVDGPDPADDRPRIVLDEPAPGPRIVLPGPDDGLDATPSTETPADAPAPDTVDDPVVLDLDEPLDPDARTHVDPTAPAGDDATGVDDALADAGLPDAGDLGAVVPLDLPADNALLQPALIAAALGIIGAGSGAILGRLRATTSPPDFVAALDEIGLDARVEHADLQDLHDRMAAGDRVLLATDGSAGVDASSVVELAFIDESSGVLEVTDNRGSRRTIDLARFRTAWADSANEMVVAAGTDGDHVALLPVVLDAPAAR